MLLESFPRKFNALLASFYSKVDAFSSIGGRHVPPKGCN
jgi:hypothetical protein